METIKLNDFIKEAKKRFGEKSADWQFVCPRCKTTQTAYDFLEAGVKKEEIEKYIGFSCIGRFTHEKGCDWTLGGFFQIHELEIEDENGKKHPHFKLAELKEKI